jgi:hypothetical protein
MNIRDIFFGLAVLAILANVVIFILIMAALDRRGYKTNILLSRIYTFRYLSAYKEATRKETGKSGCLHGLWVFTIILAAASAVVGFLCH